MIRTDRYSYASAHPGRARFRRRSWVPLLLGALLASCDPGGAGGVPSVSGDGGGTRPTEPKAWHVTTFARIDVAASFVSLYGIAQSGAALYVTSPFTGSLHSIDTSTAQARTIVAPNSRGHLDGAGTSAQFSFPYGAAASGRTLYIADKNNHRIREVRAGANAAAAVVSTLAGSGTVGRADGAGAAAQFGRPVGLTLSGNTLYVADMGNDNIRAIDLASTARTVTTIAGSTEGYADGAGTAAQFNHPTGTAVSGGTLYVADRNNHRIRAIDLNDNTVTTIAGSGIQGSRDGIGTAAQFDSPGDLAVSGDTLYVADGNSHRIRAIDLASAARTATTIAGDGTRGSRDGIGTAAQVDSPFGIVASGDTLYVTSGNLIRKLEYK